MGMNRSQPQPWNHSSSSLSSLQCGNCGTEGPGDEEAEGSSRASQWISDNVCHPRPHSSHSVVSGNHSHTMATIPVPIWLRPGVTHGDEISGGALPSLAGGSSEACQLFPDTSQVTWPAEPVRDGSSESSSMGLITG